MFENIKRTKISDFGFSKIAGNNARVTGATALETTALVKVSMYIV